MNKATQDNIDVAILSGHMSSVEAYLEVKHPDSKAYIVKQHMDEELEMYLKEDSMTRQESINYKKRLMGAVCDAEEAIAAIQNAMDAISINAEEMDLWNRASDAKFEMNKVLQGLKELDSQIFIPS